MMLGMKHLGVMLLCLCACAGSLAAQTAALVRSPESTVATSGSYQLTEQMIDQGVRVGEILAGDDFSETDVAALRGDLITFFQREPAKQIAFYESVAKIWRESLGSNPSWSDLALLRYRVWQAYAGDPGLYREFLSYPFGKMVVKYNPVLVNSGGMIVTKADVDCQFYAADLIAEIAGVEPPTQVEKDRLLRDLASQFASLPKEQQQYLTRAELRLVELRMAYDDNGQTRAAVVADIKKRVHSSQDVWREARRVASDAPYGAKRHYTSRTRGRPGFAGQALRANTQIIQMGRVGRLIMKAP